MTEIMYKGSGFVVKPCSIIDTRNYISADILRKEAGILNLKLTPNGKKTKSGHQYITPYNVKGKYSYWKFQINIKSYEYKVDKCFKNKIDAICYKFIAILKYIVFVRKLTN
mgnify:FL=1